MPRPSARLAALAPLLAAALTPLSCSAPPDSEPAPAVGEDVTGPAWHHVGYGIDGTDLAGGDDILVAYGGYTARDSYVRAWALQLAAARLQSVGVGHVYSVRGPEDPSYSAREIGNSRLAAVLSQQAAAARFIAVVAHSSGAFVADEIFTQAGADVLSKIVYFDLDGGSWALDDALVARMKGVYFVSADDPDAGESHNASAIRSLNAELSTSHLFVVDATGSGCTPGYTWCLHDCVITTRPHRPTMFDLADDYRDFTGGRAVVTSYLDRAIAEGVLSGP